ncbi:MAG: NolW protein [Proteobacteria bacterium]|nr:NolW protein [Pseudomonadota bacterium]
MKSSVRPFLFVFLASLFWIAAAAPLTHAAEPELRVIPLKHRLTDEVVPVVRPLLAPGDSVSGMDSRLIVRATPRTFAQIERLLAEIDTPRRNLRISVRHAGESERVQDSQGVSGDVRRGNTRIVVTNGNHSTGGVSVGRTGPDGNIQLHSERRITTTRDTLSQNLTVLDGGRAFLRVGESLPQVQPFLVLVGNRLGVVAGIQYFDVTTGFEVEPRTLGERIELAVMPRLAFRSNQGTQTVNFQELRTVVTVKPGEWVDLGGVVESTNEVNRQILSTHRNTGSEDSRFLIRVDPQ